ncbi:hypothetical protein T492DRAFT_1083142, partial [Pavlovales sp. CCMP2436]
MQATPSASARSNALATSSPLHFMQGHYLLIIGPINSISVNLDDPGSTIPPPPGEPPPCKIEGVCPGSRLDNPLSPRQLLLTSAPPVAAAELQAAPPAELQSAPRQHHLLDASPLAAAAELQAAPRQHHLLNASPLAAAELQASLPIVDNSTGSPPLSTSSP